jgi:phosphate-selective porin OprO/OprP
VSCKVLCLSLLAAANIIAPAAAQNATQPARTSEADAAAVETEGWKLVWDGRPSLRYGDLIRIDARARFSTEMRDSPASLQQPESSRFDIARRRIGASGSIGATEFQIEREFAGTPRWRDVYADYGRFEVASIRAGQFKLPFSLDENTSSANLDFVYRSQAASLSPGRDQGVMFHGRSGVLRYEAGMFAGDGDNGRDNDTRRPEPVSWSRAARIVVQPLRSSKSLMENLQAGIAFTSASLPPSYIDLSGPTALGRPFFSDDFATQGARTRIGLEMRWRPGPFGVQSEFVRLTSERLGQSIEDTDLPPLAASAWYVQGTWIATGEKKTRGADQPIRPVFGGGSGSLEFAARIERWRVSSGGDTLPMLAPRAETILAHGDRAVTVGINWWLNQWLRLQANLIHDTMSGADTSSFWSQVVRFQFAM